MYRSSLLLLLTSWYFHCASIDKPQMITVFACFEDGLFFCYGLHSGYFHQHCPVFFWETANYRFDYREDHVEFFKQVSCGASFEVDIRHENPFLDLNIISWVGYPCSSKVSLFRFVENTSSLQHASIGLFRRYMSGVRYSLCPFLLRPSPRISHNRSSDDAFDDLEENIEASPG